MKKCTKCSSEFEGDEFDLLCVRCWREWDEVTNDPHDMDQKSFPFPVIKADNPSAKTTTGISASGLFKSSPQQLDHYDLQECQSTSSKNMDKVMFETELSIARLRDEIHDFKRNASKKNT